MPTFRSTHSATDLFVQISLSFLPALDLCAEAVRRRKVRRSFGCLSKAQLRDIGLTPCDLVVALSLPLDRNASDALAEAAGAEAAKW